MKLRQWLLILGIALSFPVGATQYRMNENWTGEPFCLEMYQYLKNLPPSRPLLCHLFSDPDAPYREIKWKKLPVEGNERWLWRVSRARNDKDDSGDLKPEFKNDPEADFTNWISSGNLDKWLQHASEPEVYFAELDVDGHGNIDTLIGAPAVSVNRCEEFLLQNKYATSPRMRTAYVPNMNMDEVLRSSPYELAMYDTVSGQPVQFKERMYTLYSKWTSQKAVPLESRKSASGDWASGSTLRVGYYLLTNSGERRDGAACRFELPMPDMEAEDVLDRQVGAEKR